VYGSSVYAWKMLFKQYSVVFVIQSIRQSSPFHLGKRSSKLQRGTLHFTVPQVFDGVCFDGFPVLLLECFDDVYVFSDYSGTVKCKISLQSVRNVNQITKKIKPT
jgi:hypothetical protein